MQLLRRYLRARHPGGGMVEMDESDFADMVEQSPVETYIVEYREPSATAARAGWSAPASPTSRPTACR